VKSVHHTLGNHRHDGADRRTHPVVAGRGTRPFTRHYATPMAREGDFGDLDSLPQSDQHSVAKTLTALVEGFQQRDADKLSGVYSSTADWVNAFGTSKRGSEEILSYLRGLFGDANFNAGTLKAPPESNLRVLTPEVILVSTHLRVEGQRLVGGGEIEERNNFSLRVLQRQANGEWLIVSEMYNDANRESTYEPS
jgi:uncharacterized protein (TIGR02246 family)